MCEPASERVSGGGRGVLKSNEYGVTGDGWAGVVVGAEPEPGQGKGKSIGRGGGLLLSHRRLILPVPASIMSEWARPH